MKRFMTILCAALVSGAALSAQERIHILNDIYNSMSKMKFKTGKAEKTVVNVYKKIENGVVSGYQAIEDAVVGTYQKIEDKFVEKFLDVEEEVIEVPEEGDGQK